MQIPNMAFVFERLALSTCYIIAPQNGFVNKNFEKILFFGKSLGREGKIGGERGERAGAEKAGKSREEKGRRRERGKSAKIQGRKAKGEGAKGEREPGGRKEGKQRRRERQAGARNQEKSVKTM